MHLTNVFLPFPCSLTKPPWCFCHIIQCYCLTHLWLTQCGRFETCQARKWEALLRIHTVCYLLMPADSAGGLSVPPSSDPSGWNRCLYPPMRVLSSSEGKTHLSHVCQPHLHWGSVGGNLELKIKKQKWNRHVQNGSNISTGSKKKTNVPLSCLKCTFTRRLIHLECRGYFTLKILETHQCAKVAEPLWDLV